MGGIGYEEMFAEAGNLVHKSISRNILKNRIINSSFVLKKFNILVIKHLYIPINYAIIQFVQMRI